jgi:hypothetical protein
MKISLITSFICFIFQISFAQVIIQPNYGSKSHPTLNIVKIEMNQSGTIMSLSVTNEVAGGGWFCADKNIYIKDLKTKKNYKLVKAENIPVCPESHQFNKVGEVLNFTLQFPALDKYSKYIDLIEGCNNACFSFNGIILDKTINEQVEIAYDLYSKKKPELSAETFSKIITTYPDYPYGIYYFTVIKIYSEMNQWDKVKEWYHKLSESNVLDKAYYFEIIKKNKYYNQ